MNEIWKDVPGYEGRYQASSNGRIRSLPRFVTDKNGVCKPVKGRILTRNTRDKTGHRYVKLADPNAYAQVHRLVMLAFVGPCPVGMEVCHNDNNPQNNALSNLRYDTRKGNMTDMARSCRASKQKLTPEDACEIRRRFAEGERKSDMAKSYGVTWAAINAITSGRNYAWLKES